MRAVLAAGAVLAILVALLFERPHATPGPPVRDFEAYYSAGALWQHGESPYGTAIWRVEKTLDGVSPQRYEVLPFVGPPALLPVLSLFARLPFLAAAALWRAILVAALAAIAFVTLRLAKRELTLLSFAAISAAAIGFGPLTSALALGQIALPAFLFAILSVHRPLFAALAWAQPNVALTMLSQCARRIGAVAFIASAALFSAACAAVSGFGGAAAYAKLLREHGAAERFSAIQITPAAIAYGFGANEQIALAAGMAITIAALLTWALLMWRLRDDVSRFAATCAVLPLTMPFFHEHDLLVTFVPAVLFSLRASARVWPIAAAGALFCATDWLGLAQRPDGVVQTLLLVGACGAALIALRNDARASMLLVPVGTLCLIALAGWFTQTQPAPVWPDAMHALPSNVRSMSISDAWHAEQAATGLFAPQTLWALLRCASLLGSAALTFAAVVSSRSTERSKSPSPVPA